MATLTQIKQIEKYLRDYRKDYLSRKENLSGDEAKARIYINDLLRKVLGYSVEEIRTEYVIRGTYADYVVQVNKKNYFIVEAKALDIDLCDKHVKQAVDYAANEGVEWVVLSNGRYVELFRVIFDKPISAQEVFSFDLSDVSQLNKAAKSLIYLTKHSMTKGEINGYWQKVDALSVENMTKIIRSKENVDNIRKIVRRTTKINFDYEDILKSIDKVLDK